MWYERKKKFIEGIRVISQLTDVTFDENLKKIHESFMNSDGDLSFISQLDTNYGSDCSPEDSRLADKTFLYLVQRLNLFLMSPAKLQSDLTDLGFTAEKGEIVVKLYSESTREIVKKLQVEETNENTVSWTPKTTLADDTSLRCKKPTVRLNLKVNDQEITIENLGKAELGSLFDKFENIQREIDNLPTNKI